MVTDIYVRWDDMTVDEENAQYTGRTQAPESGYVFYNAADREFLKCFAQSYEVPTLMREPFVQWKYIEPAYYYASSHDKGLLAYQEQLYDALEAGQEFQGTEGYEYYQEMVLHWIKLIDFILAHADKNGLRVEFT
jgi:hypothetical protein